MRKLFLCSPRKTAVAQQCSTEYNVKNKIILNFLLDPLNEKVKRNETNLKFVNLIQYSQNMLNRIKNTKVIFNTECYKTFGLSQKFLLTLEGLFLAAFSPHFLC